jgi:hypothetical protein
MTLNYRIQGCGQRSNTRIAQIVVNGLADACKGLSALWQDRAIGLKVMGHFSPYIQRYFRIGFSCTVREAQDHVVEHFASSGLKVQGRESFEMEVHGRDVLRSDWSAALEPSCKLQGF